MIEKINSELKAVFNKEKVKQDFQRCLDFFECETKDNSSPLVICMTDDGKKVIFPKDVDVHIFSIIYQSDVNDDGDYNHFRVCLSIGDMKIAHGGLVDAEFAYATLYYNEQAECYSNDFLYCFYK